MSYFIFEKATFPDPPSPFAAFAAALASCFCRMMSASRCFLASSVIPLFPSVSFEALALPAFFLAAFSRARSRWLPLVMINVSQ